MVKIIRQYGPEDIDLHDPVDLFLMGQMLVAMLTSPKPRPDDPPEDPMWPMKRLIAQFRSAMEQEGWTLTKAELPTAYKEST